MNINNLNLNELAERCHKASVSKGWWDNPRNFGELIMLVISELGECLDADRANKHCNTSEIDLFNGLLYEGQSYKDWFEDRIKDTVADELADTAIRLLDLCNAYGIEIKDYNYKIERYPVDNFGENLLEITNQLIQIKFKSTNRLNLIIYNSFWLLFKLAEKHNINLILHIELKLKYNELRPKKHNKQY